MNDTSKASRLECMIFGRVPVPISDRPCYPQISQSLNPTSRLLKYQYGFEIWPNFRAVAELYWTLISRLPHLARSFDNTLCHINPLRAKFFRGSINTYLNFVLFLHIDTTQVVEILPQIRQEPPVYPKKYAHGFVVLCFVVVMQSFIMNSHEVFIHIHQDCFAGTGAIVRLPQCQWSKPDGYGKISQCITTIKHSKAKTVCIFLGIYCTYST